MKVTQVEPQKKNPNRFNIFLDGKFAFGADEDLVVNRRLIVGKEIDPGDLDKILIEAEVGKLMDRVYGLFSIRARSEKEIKDYLKTASYKRKLKGEEPISEMVANAVIDRAIQKGLINDLDFAKAWAESRSKTRGWQRVKQELFQKGIGREIVDELNDSNHFREDEQKTAERLLEKKNRLWSSLPPIGFRKKATDYLMRKGFEYSVAASVIDCYLKKDQKID